MRVSLVFAFVLVACGAAQAQGTAPAPDQTGVTVNFDALPIPTPRWKPTPEELNPLLAVRPRFKPDETTVQVTEATDTAAPAAQEKPAQVATAAPPPLRSTTAPTPPADTIPAPSTTPSDKQTLALKPRAQVPVTIVAPQPPTDNFPVEISGQAAVDPKATNVDPTAGFAVLSRVQFSTGKASIPQQAVATLDSLAERLLTSTERVRLAAFSGKAGDFSSNARRLSLQRALAVRAYLVGKGVPVDRVDVLAFGGATDGVTDRVDVLARGI